MQPEQPYTPTPVPASHYDFILNPQKPQKSSGIGGNAFAMKILLIVGGALLLMAAVGFGVNLLFGGKTNLGSIVGIAQDEQELVRLSDQDNQADSQLIKNASLNTYVTIKSQQIAWLNFLGKHGRKLKAPELSLKRDAAADTKLKAAQQTSAFDPAFTQVMRGKLTSYAATLKTAYDKAGSQTERTMLAQDYNAVVLLLKQWPQ